MRSLAPAPGVTPPRPEGPTHKFLSDALVARGFVTQKAMDAALHASRYGRRYSDIVVTNGDVSDDDLARTLADHHRIDHVDLDVFPIDVDVEQLLSPGTARRLGALPVALLPSGEVVVAVYDPESMANMAEIAKRIGREIRPVVASRSQVERHIEGLSASPARTDGPTPTAVPASAAVAPAPAPTPAPAPVSAPAPAPIAAQPVAATPAPRADDRSHIDEERSRIAERARALAQYRDEMPSAPPDLLQAWAPAPESEPQAHAVSHVTIPPDPQRQAAVAGSEGPATTVRDLERRLADAERRAHEAETQARVAEDRARAAEKHAEGMSAAATAANEALAQLAQARLISDQTARASVREIESLSNEIGAERAERRRLESELQRRAWHERTDLEAPHREAPAPAAEAPAPAPAPRPTAPLQPAAVQPAPEPRPARAQQPVAAQPAAQPAAAPQPAPAQQPVAARPAQAHPVAAAQLDAERRVNHLGADSKKVRGLRRMIAALRR